MINDELISAYLDGELTAEEQSQVEQALVDDARLRRMFEDLRALRNSLQSMPRQKLDANFAERVLKAAQARKNGDPPATPKSEPVQPEKEHHEPEVVVKTLHHGVASVTPAQHEPIAWRVAVWSIAGIAAALLVALLLPERTSDIAHLGNADRTKIASPELRAQPDKVAPASAPAASESESSKQLNEGQADAKTKADNQTQRGFAPQADAVQRARGGFEGAKSVGSPTVRQSAPPPEAPAPAATPGAAAPTSAQALKEATAKDEQTRGRSFAMDDNGVESLNSRRSAAPANDARNKRLAKAAESNETLVVRLTVPAAELQKRTIDQLLARENIAFANAAKKSSADADLKSTDKKAEGDRTGDVEIANAARGNDDNRFSDRALTDELAKDSERADVVVVEASLDQVQQLLDSLEARTGQQLALNSFDAESRKTGFDDRNLRGGGGGLGGGKFRSPLRDVKPAEANRKDDSADKESERKLQMEQAGSSKPGVAMRINAAQTADAKQLEGSAREATESGPPKPAPPAPANAGEAGRGAGALAKAAPSRSADGAGAGGKVEEKAEFQQRPANKPNAAQRVRVVFVIEAEPAPVPAGPATPK